MYLFLKKQEDPFYSYECLTNDPKLGDLDLTFLFQGLEAPKSAPKENLRKIFFLYILLRKTDKMTHLREMGNSGRG